MPTKKRSRAQLTGATIAALLFVLALPGPAWAAPTVAIQSDVTVSESGTQATFTITLSEASATDVNVTWDTGQGFTGSGLTPACDNDNTSSPCTQPTSSSFDYSRTQGSHTFVSGASLTRTVNVPVFSDTFDEEDSEVFSFVLTNVQFAAAGDTEARGTINDDDAPPTISMGDTSVAEGNSGQSNGNIPITISGVSQKIVQVSYGTADGTAVNGNDYATRQGNVTFNPGEFNDSIPVTVLGETNDENDENFFYNLSNPQNATIADGQGTVTITDDDSSPSVSISISDAILTEGNSGTKDATLTVSLSGSSPSTITVNYATSNGSASQGSDYGSKNGTLTFNPGQTSQPVNISIFGDTTTEPNETFTVSLSGATNAFISDAVGSVTITNDDGTTPSPSPSPTSSTSPSPTPTSTGSPSPSPTTTASPSPTATPAISVDDTSVIEGDDGTVSALLTVSLSAPGTKVVGVSYATSDGTATFDNGDFDDKDGSLSFQIGQTGRTLTINVRGDTEDEDMETFNLHLSSPTNATIADGTAEITIVDDDDGGGPVDKDPSAISFLRSQTAKRIKLTGDLNPAHPGEFVTVELFKKRNGKFRLLTSKNAELGPGIPSPSGGAEVSPFSTKFRRPKGGKCKLKASWAGDADHEATKSTQKFSC